MDCVKVQRAVCEAERGEKIADQLQALSTAVVMRTAIVVDILRIPPAPRRRMSTRVYKSITVLHLLDVFEGGDAEAVFKRDHQRCELHW